jgi:uncharacterized protein (TIGR01777 family)
MSATKTILIAGGTGMIGSRLAGMLRESGHQVRILSRSTKQPGVYAWDPSAGQMDDAALDGVDYVVNLAGAGIADGRWTAARKQLIRDSRIQASETLATAFIRSGMRPRAYIGASAIGYYGNTGDQWNVETDPPGSEGFMPPVCVDWERSHAAVAGLGIRTVVPRIGVVLDKSGGALPEIMRPVRIGVGTYFADGQAWYAWIHILDVCRFMVYALEQEALSGVYNAVAPHPVRNKALVSAVAEAMGRSVWTAPAPALALRMMLGEMADVVLNSNRVSAEKTLKSGFLFTFPQLKEALTDIFSR